MPCPTPLIGPRLEGIIHISRKLLKDSSKAVHKVRDPRPAGGGEGNASHAIGVCQ